MTTTRSAARVPAADAPVARVLPLLGVPHLDREFDYRVPETMSADARPGTRVRVRFAGRLVDGFVVARTDTSEHAGELAWLERVVSPEQVLTPELLALVDLVARRWVGTRSDVLRLAIPPRHAAAEKSVPEPEPPQGGTSGPVEIPEGWADHPMAARFLDAVTSGVPARAVWTVPPGRDWAQSLAALADSVRRRGLQVLLIVPDQRDVDRLTAACRQVVGGGSAGRDLVTDLSAGVGPSARYRRWLRAVRGHARIVVGTRSAVFTPLPEPGLIVLHDDGDDSFVEPRSPYPHTREVAAQRSALDATPLLLSSVDRTPEVAEYVRSGWAHEIRPEPGVIRALAPRVVAFTAADPVQARDVAGGRTRLPAVALTMAREAIDVDAPVLVQVPRKGYIPTLLCGSCRAPARCRRCNGPLRAGRMDAVYGPVDLACGWCGAPESGFRCVACGSRALRAGVVGAGRTAEELGRMFPGVRVRTSGGGEILDSVPASPAIIVSTPGAEPTAEGGYGAALLLDSWALLGRPDLRAVQNALRLWIGAASLVRPAADGGRVFLSADSDSPVSQALVRWDPQGWAERELADRAEVGFPPAVHMMAVDGPATALAEILTALEVPDEVEVLGPVDLPDGEELPGHDRIEDPERVLLRIPPSLLGAVSTELRAVVVGRSGRRNTEPVRVRLDPIHIG
ncbi:primosomal protein N' [Rhodococcus sp. IEGM 1408]|uniref:primosomal protein N' n=1 Tax=Rhodococcus sp. IEGM 1408 TaxID=3082220 RepID=UPI0029544A3C|nr:primosomal protein N' [Rhodococcus sp. IEGM 1408]MDV8000300.1 primosomal protein N' [Rhodococcus sp. IEGM 1408]